MKKLKVILLILTVLLVIPFGVFAEEGNNAPVEESNEVKVYLFHGEGCGFCEKAKTWFASIEAEYGHKFELVKYEVWNDEYNSKLMQAVADVRKENPGGVPYIVIGNQSWDGFAEDYQDSILAKINSEYDQAVSERYDVMNFVDFETLKPVEAESNTAKDVLVLLVIIAVVGLVTAGIIVARKETN